MNTAKPNVWVVYNHTGEDEYEKLKEIDPKTLDFNPVYKIDVATVSEEYEAVCRGLREAGYRAKLLNAEDNFKKLHRSLSRSRPDAIFNLVEYFHDDPELEAPVAGYFDLMRIPYTGAPPSALSLCQKKGFTKRILAGHGIPTPHFRMLNQPRIPRRHGLKYPLIVKPAREDASSGVNRDSVVYDHPSLLAQLEKIFAEFSPPILVEEFIEGRELHISILGNHPPKVLPAIEFDFSELPDDHPKLISYEMKWSPLDQSYHQVHTVCPAELSKKAIRKIEEAVIPAYTVTGCRDYARIDMRMNAKGEVFILEVNPNPDLTEGVSFMESAEEAGLSFSETLRVIVEGALERKPAEIPIVSTGAPPEGIPDAPPAGIPDTPPAGTGQPTT